MNWKLDRSGVGDPGFMGRTVAAGASLGIREAAPAIGACGAQPRPAIFDFGLVKEIFLSLKVVSFSKHVKELIQRFARIISHTSLVMSYGGRRESTTDAISNK